MSMTELRRPVSLVAGALSAGIGLLGLALSGGQSHYLVFGAVLVAGGAVLLWLGLSGGRPGVPAWSAVGVLAVAGLLAGLLVVREDVCCMFVYHRNLGYPWAWLDSHLEVETMAQVEAIAAAPGDLPRHLDLPKLIIDAIFWLNAAILAVVPAALLLRRRNPGG